MSRLAATGLIGLLLNTSNVAACETFSIEHVRVEQQEMHASATLFVDTPAPRFSWSTAGSHPLASAIIQQSYRIQILEAVSEKLVWDSGVVASNRSILIEYGSTGHADPLGSHGDYKVDIDVTLTGGESCASSDLRFRTGILVSISDDASAAWEAMNSTWISRTSDLPKTECECYDEEPH